MVPQEDLAWLMEQPDTILSARATAIGRLGLRYLMPNVDFHDDMCITNTIRRDVTRNLECLHPSALRDMSESVDALFGTNSDTWLEINLYEAVEKTLSRSMNRVLLGGSLSLNEAFLHSSMTFANLLGAGAVLVGQFSPPVIKPLIGYILSIPIYIGHKAFYKYLLPEIQQRMDNLQRKRSEPAFEWNEPKDMLMWFVIAAMEKSDPKVDIPKAIAERIFFLVSRYQAFRVFRR